jgi:hypothetical protein
LATCSDDGRTTTRQTKQLVGNDYPFLFSPPGYEVAHHWHDAEEFQLLAVWGSIVFVRRSHAKPITAEKLRGLLLRAAHRAHYQSANADDLIDEDPPARG